MCCAFACVCARMQTKWTEWTDKSTKLTELTWQKLLEISLRVATHTLPNKHTHDTHVWVCGKLFIYTKFMWIFRECLNLFPMKTAARPRFPFTPSFRRNVTNCNRCARHKPKSFGEDMPRKQTQTETEQQYRISVISVELLAPPGSRQHLTANRLDWDIATRRSI